MTFEGMGLSHAFKSHVVNSALHLLGLKGWLLYWVAFILSVCKRYDY